MASLSELWAALLNEDGSPDITARRHQIDSFLSQLPSSDLRHIHDRLEALTTATWTVDFIPKLPVEIVMCIVCHMTLKDHVTAQTVSKSWYHCFMRIEVLEQLAKKHFAVAWHTSLKTIPPSACVTLFRSLSRKWNAIYQGNYASRHYFSYGTGMENEHSNSTTRNPIRRFNGHLVAWSSNEVIYLRNLITGDTKRFVTPERFRITDFCMQGDCLLAICASTTVYIWSISTEEMQTVRLTSTPSFFDINNGNVLFGYKNGTVLLWNHAKGGARELDAPAVPKESLILFLGFHPLSENAFVRCSIHLVENHSRDSTVRKEVRLVAQKFTDQNLLSCDTIDLPLSSKGQDYFDNDQDLAEALNDERPTAGFPPEFPVVIPGNNQYGFDAEGCFNVTVNCDCVENGICYHSRNENSQNRCLCSSSFLRMCYSPLDGQWRKDVYASPRGTQYEILSQRARKSAIYFVQNQALTPIYTHPSYPDMGSDSGLFLIGTDQLNEATLQAHLNEVSVLETFRRRNLRCVSGTDGKDIVHRHIMTHGSTTSHLTRGLPVRYAWTSWRPSRDIPSGPGGPCFKPRDYQIYGNMNFTVLFRPDGFVVWCYDKDLVLPNSPDQEEMTLNHWPELVPTDL